MLTSGLFALPFGKKGSEGVQPLAAAGQQIVYGERIRQFLEPLGIAAAQEGVGSLLEIDSLLSQAMGQPMVLVETDTCREGEVGTHANEHPPPVAIVDVEVVLHDPTLGQLEMPSVVLLVPDSDQDPCRFARLQNDHHLVGLSPAKIGFDKLIASTFGSF